MEDVRVVAQRDASVGRTLVDVDVLVDVHDVLALWVDLHEDLQNAAAGKDPSRPLEVNLPSKCDLERRISNDCVSSTNFRSCPTQKGRK